LPLSVMMSGNLAWGSGNLYRSGTDGYFWASTPYAYTSSRHFSFYSANVAPKGGFVKSNGLSLRCVAFPSRALRSLPLSFMMSGYYGWGSGNLIYRGTDGRFWVSTPVTYTSSRYLYFGSSNVIPKYGDYSPSGFSLRCVAFPSRALRSLPLSVMMSGDIHWYSGNLNDRGTYGRFWTSSSNVYIHSRYLYFSSAGVNPMNSNLKPYGFPLRRVAQPSKLNTLSLPNRPLMTQHGGYDRVLGGFRP
ncbi:hypothetical protein IKF63_01035, partial [Candidatus Saccharibacteria bacterium]|nr:hypothetical protein [Candidatus Saccharibacteria bacterium]